MKPHLRDLPLAALPGLAGSEEVARRLAVLIHRRGATQWDELELAPRRRRRLEKRARFGPLLEETGADRAADRTHRTLLRAADGAAVEVVLIRNRRSVTACLSSQAGCALGCTFCATGELGLSRNLTAGEITESMLHAQRRAGVRVTDVVFMGQGEPLANYAAVMTACGQLTAGRLALRPTGGHLRAPPGIFTE